MPQVELLPHPISVEQLEDFASEMLQLCKAGDAKAAADFAELGPADKPATEATLEIIQSVIAAAYQADSWQRIVLGARMVAALRGGDFDTVRALIEEHPSLLHEHAHGFDSNWGPPMSYAANLGRDEIIKMLADLGAKDFQHALGRACLCGRIDTARLLIERGAKLERGMVMGCCETQNVDGLKLLLDLGAELCDETGDTKAPIALLLGTYIRYPDGKHECLGLVVDQGVELPDTPIMALHRGRIDLLEQHLKQDPDLSHRRFSLREIYPPAVGFHDEAGLHGTPLDGTTLLHMCADFDEMDIARWLIENGANVNAAATVDDDGFGAHTPLFNAVVSQANINGRQQDGAMAKLLLDHGADPNVQVTIRKQLRYAHDETTHEYRDVTPLAYGRAFHAPRFSNPVVMKLLEEAT